MKNLKFLFVFLSIISCSRNNDTTENPTATKQYFVKFKINGVQKEVKSEIVNGNIIIPTASFREVLSSANGNGYEFQYVTTISFSIKDYPLKNKGYSYIFGGSANTLEPHLTYKDPETNDTYFYYGTSGSNFSSNIISSSDNEVRGNFSGKLNSTILYQGTNPKTFTITDGEFYLQIQK